MLARRIIHAGLLLIVLLTAAPLAGQAPAPLDVATLKDSAPMRPHLAAYLDPQGELTLDAIRAAPPAPVKLPSDADISFGLTRATLWLAFDIQNTSAEVRSFMLELGYPHLDEVSLFVVHADGRREQRVTGDSVPFAQRDVITPNFVFRLDASPRSKTTYYLRLQTSGLLKAPLTVWEHDAFFEQHQDHAFGMWVFYGVLLVLILYNLGVYMMIRQWEYLAYVLLLLSLASVIATLNGHTFQYFLPTRPDLANRAMPVTLALALGAGARFARHIVGSATGLERDVRIVAMWQPVAALLMVFVLLAEPGIGTRVMLGTLGLALVHTMIQFARLLTRLDLQLQVYVMSWVPLILAMPVQFLRYVNVLPQSMLTDFSAHIAIAMHGITTSLTLASRVNLMREGLRDLNTQLSHNVAELSAALARAEEASKQAECATIAKDEFMATMSHELRTPLNAIINVPQGLLEDFAQQPIARCGACSATFVLDPGEQVEAGIACPECAATGTLVADSRTSYQGNPERTVQYLRRIERSGRHLLQMVNGVLDFSKIEAGHLALQPLQVDLGGLLREVVDDIGDLAAKKQLRIALDLPEQALPTVVDPTRVKQIVLNLLSNAVKFTDEARTITVRWRALPEVDVVEVQDQGIGIDPADHERVFQRFEQVHKGDTRKYGGTGLGLPISRSLARMHGGDLTVRSRRGAGSTFMLTLPRRALRRTTGSMSIQAAG